MNKGRTKDAALIKSNFFFTTQLFFFSLYQAAVLLKYT